MINMAARSTTCSISSFLKTSRLSLNKILNGDIKLNDKNNINLHVVIGNEAADADSIVSALCCAYIKSMKDSSKSLTTHYVPVCCIPRSDLILRRDISILFQLTGLDMNDLICLDDCKLELLSKQAKSKTENLKITLTDHNEISRYWKDDTVSIESHIIEIIDHHKDKGKYPSIVGKSRRIAFNHTTGVETAGSTCTLIAESILLPSVDCDSHGDSGSCVGSDEKKENKDPVIMPELARLLSGVILLDTSNMNKDVGKGKIRDEIMLQKLLPLASVEIEGLMEFERETVFKALKGAKTDPEFWKSMAAADMLRLDYKEFRVQSKGGGESKLGMASMVCHPHVFEDKILQDTNNHGQSIDTSLARYLIGTESVDFLVVMCAYDPALYQDYSSDSNAINGACGMQRTLSVFAIGKKKETNTKIDALETFVSRQNSDRQANLVPRIYRRKSYHDNNESGNASDGDELCYRLYTQGNVKMSRKQMAPILESFLSSY